MIPNYGEFAIIKIGIIYFFCHFLLFGGVEAGEKVVVEGGFLFDVVEDHADEGVALEFAAHLLEVAPAVAFGGGVEAEADV